MPAPPRSTRQASRGVAADRASYAGAAALARSATKGGSGSDGKMIFLVTGSAGFIGFHVAQYLLDHGEQVIGIDNLNPYYDVALKQARLARLEGREGFSFQPVDGADPAAMTALVERHRDIPTIIHLAAQAGGRYPPAQPPAYVGANLKGQVVLPKA